MSDKMYKAIFDDYNECKKNKFIAQWSDNAIWNMLTYLKIGTLHPTFSRIYYDGDARYFYTHQREKGREFAERGDIMVSFFTPYKYALKKATGVTYHKSNIADLDKLLSLVDSSNLSEVNQEFMWFAKNYMNRGNILLLPPKTPDGRMNCNRYICSEDRIDNSLLECFEGGKLSKYFDGDEQAKKWIEDEGLEILFLNKEVSKVSLTPFTPRNPFVRYNDMSLEELFRYIRKTREIIEYRDFFFNDKKARME